METRTHYIAEVKGIKDQVVTMGDRVIEALQLGLKCLIEADKDSAQNVFDLDKEIDDMQIAIEDRVTLLIAKETPVATDLRELLTVFKVVVELERLGDHAKHLARSTGNVSKEGLGISQPFLQDMTDFGCQMVKEALESFIEFDSKWAKEIASRDNYIDEKYYDLYDRLVNIIKEKPRKTENLIPLLFLNRYLERIGDRVTNICEDIVFAITCKHIDLG